MLARTKFFSLKKKRYVRLAFRQLLRKQVWWILAAFAVCNAGILWWFSWWWAIGSTLALGLYLLFWFIQFSGVTYLEQFKFLFQKLSYEITSQQILIRINNKQGMPVRWEQIRYVYASSSYFLLFMSKAQFIYLPHHLFASPHHVKFIEGLLRRKGYIR